jgi:hypothetical protein
MTNVTKWAVLVFNPKQATSEIPDAKPELTVAVEVDGEKTRLYWVAGGLCDLLQKGDRIMVEYVKGKWKIAKSQPPELMAALESRRAPTAAPAPAAPGVARPDNDNDIIEMGAIAGKLAAILPDWTEQAIASLACTVFISRRK